MNESKENEVEQSSEETCPSIQEIVKRYLPDVEWTGATQGRATCPGRHKHTSRSHRNDCWVFINGTPTVTCLHDSCRQEILGVNASIRNAWSLFQPELDPALLALAKEKAAKKHELEAKSAASLPEILKQYRWDVDALTIKHNWSGSEQTERFLNLMFDTNDLIWIGNPETTGRPEHTRFFKHRAEWILRPGAGNYTCASTFKPGTYSRANVNVATTPYMIVEGDKVLGKEPETDEDKGRNRDACGAIFRWLVDCCGIKLRAVVDSGNKSLHGWFDMPSEVKFEELKIVLPAMGCDRAMFKPTQPARLPGCIRDNGKEQKLLWIS